MTSLKCFLSIAAITLSAISLAPQAAFPQAAQDHKAHHPDSAPATAVPKSAPNDTGADHPQAQKEGMMSGQMMGGEMMGGMHGGASREASDGCPGMMGGMLTGGDPATRAHGRIAFLKAELAITDAQAEAWESYAAALEKNFENMHASRMAMGGIAGAQSPVERLEKHLATMQGRLAALKQLQPALTNLYAALNEAQKKTASQLLTGIGCMM